MNNDTLQTWAMLNSIHALLDGKEWNADTLNEIADLLIRAGYIIKDPDGYILAAGA